MLQAMRQRRQSDEKGFTLIELMVVVLIIAILIAIAIPAFLGARKRAQDRSAQANLRTAFSGVETFHADDQSYTDTVAELKAEEPSIGWVAANSPTRDTNSVAIDAEDTSATPDGVKEKVLLGTWSKSGNCYYIRVNDTTDEGPQYNSAEGETASDCSLTAADAYTNWEGSPEDGWDVEGQGN